MASSSRSLKSVLALLIVTLAGIPGVAFASEDVKVPYVWDGPTLHLLWNDAYDLLPATAFDAMREEVEEMFATNGISVRVHRARPGLGLDEFPEPRFNAVLFPVEASSWNLAPDVMAAAVGEPGRKPTIFVFYPGVMRTLRHKTFELSPFKNRDLARGMGRIVAHELVHVLAPKRGHARSGLMAAKLTRSVLLKKEIALDIVSRNTARASVEELADSKKRVADTRRLHVAY